MNHLDSNHYQKNNKLLDERLTTFSDEETRSFFFTLLLIMMFMALIIVICIFALKTIGVVEIDHVFPIFISLSILMTPMLIYVQSRLTPKYLKLMEWWDNKCFTKKSKTKKSAIEIRRFLEKKRNLYGLPNVRTTPYEIMQTLMPDSTMTREKSKEERVIL